MVRTWHPRPKPMVTHPTYFQSPRQTASLDLFLALGFLLHQQMGLIPMGCSRLPMEAWFQVPTLQMGLEDFHQMAEDSLPCIRHLGVLVFQPLVAAPNISSSNKANM